MDKIKPRKVRRGNTLNAHNLIQNNDAPYSSSEPLDNDDSYKRMGK